MTINPSSIPLNAVRAFEAAARSMSFSKAAEELNVTQGAVSRQVCQLEQYLELALFDRIHRGVALTKDGLFLFREVHRGLATIESAIATLLTQRKKNAINLSVVPSLAHGWLIPRLADFSLQHPGIDVHLSMSLQLVNFKTENFDAGIRYGPGEYPDLHIDYLFTPNLFPVCAPTYLERTGPLTHPRDLLKRRLLHDPAHKSWRHWFLKAGVRVQEDLTGPYYSDLHASFLAAIAGQGVALGRSRIVDPFIEQGLLVKPFQLEWNPGWSYYFVYPAHRYGHHIEAFREWLLQQANPDHRSRSQEMGNPSEFTFNQPD